MNKLIVCVEGVSIKQPNVPLNCDDIRDIIIEKPLVFKGLFGVSDGDILCTD